MKRFGKYLAGITMLTVLQGTVMCTPNEASAIFDPGWNLNTTFLDLSLSNINFNNIYENSVLRVSDFTLPAGTTTFTASGLQVSGTSLMGGTYNVANFVGNGTVNFDGLLQTVITGNAGASLGNPGWNWAGATPLPAPRPRRDGDFATIVEGVLNIENILLSWDYGANNAPGEGQTVVGLVAAMGGIIGDLQVGTVKDGWALRRTTIGALNATQAQTRMMLSSAGDILPDDTQVIVAEAVPEPSTILLVGVGLAGLAGAGVRRQRKNRLS